MKRRVLSFFTVLIMLALVLSFIQFVNFGNLSGFAIWSDVAGNSKIPNISFENSSGVVFGLALLIFVFISALILSKLEKHRERNHLQLISDKQPFTRKLIPISYD
ncbi:MAG: hypothetical protein WCK29_01120 [archaeon]